MNKKSYDWAEKYRPQTLSQVVGHPKVIDNLKNWALSWEEGIPKDKALLLYGRAGIGKCCKGDTLILTDRGLVKIEDIVHKQADFSNRYIDHGQTNFYDNLYDSDNNDIDEALKNEDNNIKNINNIISISPKLNYEKYEIIDRYDIGENNIITIKTRLGLEISGTPEHKVIIIDKNGKLRFKKLQDISTLDHIVISYNTNIFNNKLKLNFFYRKKRTDYSSQILKNIDYMNPDVAELLGYIIAEGNDDDNVVITNYDREIVDRMLDICKIVDIDAHERYEGEKLVGVTIGSIAFKEFVYYLGYRKLAQNKEVPWSILQADKDSQISFIRAIFDGDGTVWYDSNALLVEYNSSSYELCRQLQIMLLNLGIIGRLHSKKGARLEYRGEIREDEESYRLSITGGEILKFAEIINFGLPRKKEILHKCVETLENRDRWTDITYHNIEKIINRLYDELKMLGKNGKIIKKWQEDFVIGNKTIKLDRQKAINCKEYLKNDQYLICQYASGKRQPSIYGLKRILSVMGPVSYLSEYKYLEILSNQFIFDNVVTIKYEKTRVYDVTIDDVHSYIGNSIINHNTASAHALAHDMEWEFVELNASDQRTASIIEKIVGSASQIGTLGIQETKRLIIIDEADNIHGTADRGGEKALIGIIKKTNQPIILIANELYDISQGLRHSCRLIQFKSVSESSIANILNKIAKDEGILCGTGVIEKIVENAGGDLRGAINDLQAISQGKTEIKLNDVVIGARDTKENIFKALQKIFRGKSMNEAIRATYNLDENPEDFIQWIDENLPFEFTNMVDLNNGYNYLSRASQFLGRVRRRQDYGMWKYASVLMTSGMFVAKSHKYTNFLQFQTPSIRKKLGQSKAMRNIRDSVAKKIGNKCHVSMSFARSNLFPLFKMMMKNEKYSSSVAALLGLEPEEIAFLLDGLGESNKIVQKIYHDAQELINKEKDYDIELFGGFGIGKKLSEKMVEDKETMEEYNVEDKETMEEYNIEDKEIVKKEKEEEKEVKKEEKSQKSLFDF